MLIGIVAYAIVFGMMSVLLHEKYAASSHFTKQMRSMQASSNKLRLNETTQTKLLLWAKTNYDAQWNSGVLLMKQTGMPSSLKKEVIEAAFRDIFVTNIVFAYAPNSILLYFAQKMEFVVSIPNENIIEEYDINEYIYVIKEGKVLVSSDATG